MIEYYAIFVVIFIIALVALYYRCSREVPILIYHRIADIPGDRLSVSPDKFAMQMKYLQTHGYNSISLEELYVHLTEGVKLPKKSVIITFDDAYDDNFLNALPLMQKYGMRGTVFAITNWIDKDNDWENYPGKPICHTMSWEQLRAWNAAGMEIGSHSMAHPALVCLTDDAMLNDLAGSKLELEKQLGILINFIAYPYGVCDARVKKITKQAGYLAAVAIYTGSPLWSNDLFGLRRIVVSEKNSVAEFAMKVSPWHLISIGLRRGESNFKRFLKSLSISK